MKHVVFCLECQHRILSISAIKTVQSFVMMPSMDLICIYTKYTIYAGVNKLMEYKKNLPLQLESDKIEGTSFE